VMVIVVTVTVIVVGGVGVGAHALWKVGAEVTWLPPVRG